MKFHLLLIVCLIGLLHSCTPTPSKPAEVAPAQVEPAKVDSGKYTAVAPQQPASNQPKKRAYHNKYIFGGQPDIASSVDSMKIDYEVDEKNQITAEISVRISGEKETKPALLQFGNEVKSLFDLFQLKVPAGLLEAIQQGKEFKTEYGIYSIHTEHKNKNKNAWTFVMTHK